MSEMFIRKWPNHSPFVCVKLKCATLIFQLWLVASNLITDLIKCIVWYKINSGHYTLQIIKLCPSLSNTNIRCLEKVITFISTIIGNHILLTTLIFYVKCSHASVMRCRLSSLCVRLLQRKRKDTCATNCSKAWPILVGCRFPCLSAPEIVKVSVSPISKT